MTEFVDYGNDNRYEDGHAQALNDGLADTPRWRTDFTDKSLPYRDGYEATRQRMEQAGTQH